MVCFLALFRDSVKIVKGQVFWIIVIYQNSLFPDNEEILITIKKKHTLASHEFEKFLFVYKQFFYLFYGKATLTNCEIALKLSCINKFSAV